jgi:hypothetical protein
MAAQVGRAVLSHGAFVALALQYGPVLGQDALFVGLKGGWLANHRFAVGAGGFVMTSHVSPPPGAPRTAQNVTLAYGGLWLEYIFLHDKPVHGALGALLAVGEAGYRVPATGPINPGEDFESDLPDTTVLVLEPSASIELSLTRSVRLAAGVSYRTVGTAHLDGLRERNLSGLTGSVMLKAGLF